ncbi:O-antigen ligase family protein [Nocardioides sp. Leaf307]|uniref:O-antigen ligase family protein n=1 Tax=Nocardioides sp. Leaf307 TaxID=1736331 RepID=UPI000702BA5E|nr:O-antigen ligase family protein [Nocardioides sp. Leaf307]KQQ43655.1 hypothetical protein ASF50_07010 [Nocardioides sp. Leaf307]
MTLMLREAPSALLSVGRPRRHDPSRRTRPAWLHTVLPVLLALLGGVSVGLAPGLTGLVVLAVVVLTLLLGQIEIAALVVVAASVFEDYLVFVSPAATKTLAVVVVVAWAVRRAARPFHHAPRSPVLVSAGVLVVVLLLSTLVTGSDGAAVATLGRWAGFLAVLVVLADCLRGRLAPTVLAEVYVASCALAALCALVVFPSADGDRRVGGPVADPNDFAFYLLAAVPLGLAVRAESRRPRAWDLATVLCAVALAGTYSRGAVLGLLVALGVAVVVRLLPWRAVGALLVVVVTAVAFTASVNADLVRVSFEQKQAVAQENVSQRLELWQQAARMTLDAPLLGHGPGSFAEEHQDYAGDAGASVADLDTAHNTYLEVAAELGLLGLLALLSVLGTAFAGAWARWRRDRSPLAAGVCTALVGTGVAASFLSEQFYLPLWLLAALAVAVSVGDRAPARRPPRVRRAR